MNRYFDVLNSRHFDNNILITRIKIDSQYVNSALPNIKLSFITPVTVRPNVRKKGGIVRC